MSVVVEVCLERVLVVVADEDALSDTADERHVIGVFSGIAPATSTTFEKGVEVETPFTTERVELSVIDESTLEVGIAFNGLEIHTHHIVYGCLIADEVCKVVAHDLFDELFGDGYMNTRNIVGKNTTCGRRVCFLNTINHPAEMDGSGGRRRRSEGREVARSGRVVSSVGGHDCVVGLFCLGKTEF